MRGTAATAVTPRRAGSSRQEGDDLFNARDWQALDDVHHPDMIAFIPRNAEPIYGREAHGAAMKQLVRMFPDVRVATPVPDPVLR